MRLELRAPTHRIHPHATVKKPPMISPLSGMSEKKDMSIPRMYGSAGHPEWAAGAAVVQRRDAGGAVA